MPSHQYSLSLITHQVQDSIVEQRASDGYINATAMCKAAGKKFNDYRRLGTTGEFLEELASVTGIPVTKLVESTQHGKATDQGSWVHPDVATHLAQWLSARFAVMVAQWVREWLSGQRTPAKLPYHLERHMLNYHKVPTGSFSVLQEMTTRLVAPMEAQGYRLPEKLMPDISYGRMLCKFLREKKGIDTNSLPVYVHTFPDGREVEAKLYPVEFLGDFVKLLTEVWLAHKALAYFKERDPSALEALDKMMLIGHVQPTKTLAANKKMYKKKA